MLGQRIKSVCWLVIVFAVSTAVCAQSVNTSSTANDNPQSTTFISSSVKNKPLADRIDYLEDPQHSYKWEDITSGKHDSQFIHHNKSIFEGTNLTSVFWFRFKLKWDNHLQPSDRFLLYLASHPATIYEIELGLPQADGSIKKLMTGIMHADKHDRAPGLHNAFYLAALPGQEQTLYLRMNNSQSGFPILLKPHIVDQQTLLEINNNTEKILICFYTLMLTLLLYNTALFVTLRQPLYGYYLLFIAVVTIDCSYVDGSTSQYWFADSPEKGNFYSVLAAMAYLAFVYHVLDRIFFWPAFTKIYRVMLSVGALCLLHGVFIGPIIIVNALTQIYNSVVLLICIAIIMGAIKRKVPTARLILGAESMTIGGAFTFLLMLRGVLPINDFTYWSFHGGFLLEALLLSFAVAARTNIHVQEKIRMQEITLQLREEKMQTEAAMLETQAMSRVKNEFFASMSHEIRTPMNGVMGLCELLLGRELDAQSHQYVKTIYRSADSLLAIINDILDLSKIDAGKMELEIIDVELESLIDDSILIISATISDKPLKLLPNIASNCPRWFRGDPIRLRQILLNFLSNACKFTESGDIKIDVELDQEKPSSQQLKFSISDRGIGLTASQQEKIFQAFSQADSSTTRKYGGTGLGLLVCKNLVDLMQGEIGVISEYTKGATFWFSIPYQVTVAQQPKLAPPLALPILANLRVLVAEDNPTNQLVIKGMLGKFAIEPVMVNDGEQAVRAALGASCQFDLIFMDCEMPLLNGFEATKAIRKLEENMSRSQYIVALSAHVIQIEIDRATQAGMNQFVKKPVHFEDIKKVLAQVIEKTSQANLL